MDLGVLDNWVSWWFGGLAFEGFVHWWRVCVYGCVGWFVYLV